MNLKEHISTMLARFGGWCDPDKALKLCDLIFESKPKTVVEVGVFAGKSAISMALACKLNGGGVVYGVDSWCASDCIVDENQANTEWWSTKVNLDRVYEECLRHIAEEEVGGHINILKLPSRKAAFLFDSVDLLHIDGNHAELPSTTDVLTWVPLLRSGGYLILDDFNWDSQDTARRMIEKMCDPVSEHSLKESCFAVYRKR